MKYLILYIIIQLPICSFAQYNHYYGNLHSHTEYSDGNKDSVSANCYNPAQSYTYAKQSYHTDYWGISEHNHYNANNNPGMLRYRYPLGLYQADTSNANGSFVAMYGLEWGVISQGGHAVTYGSPGLIGWETISGNPNYDTFCAEGDFNSYWSLIHSIPNAFVTLAHPQTGDYNDLLGNAPFNPIADSAIVGTAIRSGTAFSTTTDYSDLPATSYEDEYKQALSKGYHVGPTIDHDNHYTTFGRTNQGRTVILANSLQRDSLIEAMLQRRFYASDDWNAQIDYTLNNEPMGKILTNPSASSIRIFHKDVDAEKVSKIELFYGIPKSNQLPVLLASSFNSDSLIYIHYSTLDTTYYYYCKVTQFDGDIIWSSPIWNHTNSTPAAIQPILLYTQNNFSASIYPNPIIDKFTIQYSSNTSFPCTLKLYNSSGNLVYTTQFQINAITDSINISNLINLPIDNYFLTLGINNKIIYESKVLKIQ